MNPKKTKMPQLSIDKYKDMKVINKKFLSQKEGAELYSMGIETFRTLANEANAVYKIGKKVLINAEVFEEYLESFCLTTRFLKSDKMTYVVGKEEKHSWENTSLMGDLVIVVMKSMDVSMD